MNALSFSNEGENSDSAPEHLKGLTDTSLFASRTQIEIENLSERIDSLDLEKIAKNAKQLKDLQKEIVRYTTGVYRACWHSEQRLFYFLFSGSSD